MARTSPLNDAENRHVQQLVEEMLGRFPSRRKLAEYLGVSVQTVSNILTGNAVSLEVAHMVIQAAGSAPSGKAAGARLTAVPTRSAGASPVLPLGAGALSPPVHQGPSATEQAAREAMSYLIEQDGFEARSVAKVVGGMFFLETEPQSLGAIGWYDRAKRQLNSAPERLADGESGRVTGVRRALLLHGYEPKTVRQRLAEVVLDAAQRAKDQGRPVPAGAQETGAHETGAHEAGNVGSQLPDGAREFRDPELEGLLPEDCSELELCIRVVAKLSDADLIKKTSKGQAPPAALEARASRRRKSGG